MKQPKTVEKSVHESAPFAVVHSGGDLKRDKVPVELRTGEYFEGPRHKADYRRLSLEAAKALGDTLSIKRERDQGQIDSRTGLPNANALDDNIERAIRHNTMADKPVTYVMAMVDVNNLKTVNDASEDKHHSLGNIYLRSVADAIKANLYPGDVPARYGGDEFMILMPVTEEMPTIDKLQVIYSQNFRESFEPSDDVRRVLGAYGLTPGAAIGMALWDGMSRESFDEASSVADKAMYEDKMAAKHST